MKSSAFFVTMICFSFPPLEVSALEANQAVQAAQCSPIGGSCLGSSDCCTNLCSPTSCMQGQCIGSMCLSNGNFCKLDCQCCSGACIFNSVTPGRCGVPSKAIPARHCAGNSCVSDNPSDTTPIRSEVCCPLNKKAVCSINGSSCEDPALTADCPGSSCSIGCGVNCGWQCAVCCPVGTPAFCGSVKDGYGCINECVCGNPEQCGSVTEDQVVSSIGGINVTLLTVAIVASAGLVAVSTVLILKHLRRHSGENVPLMQN